MTFLVGKDLRGVESGATGQRAGSQAQGIVLLPPPHTLLSRSALLSTFYTLSLPTTTKFLRGRCHYSPRFINRHQGTSMKAEAAACGLSLGGGGVSLSPFYR